MATTVTEIVVKKYRVELSMEEYTLLVNREFDSIQEAENNINEVRKRMHFDEDEIELKVKIVESKPITDEDIENMHKFGDHYKEKLWHNIEVPYHLRHIVKEFEGRFVPETKKWQVKTKPKLLECEAKIKQLINENKTYEESLVKIYLIVPFEKKDIARDNGAKWDKNKKKWYVLDEQDAKTIKELLKQKQPLQPPKPEIKKIYLNVPFEKKDIAKELGARWDSIMKKWYVLNEENAEKILTQMIEPERRR